MSDSNEAFNETNEAFNETNEAFSEWAIVEVMGHSRYAGLVSEQVIAGQAFVRVDVPQVGGELGMTEDGQAFTKLLGGSSIFAITPCSERAAKRAAQSFRSRPCELFDMYAAPAIENAAEVEAGEEGRPF